MTIGRYNRPSIVRWGVLVPGPVEFYIISAHKRTWKSTINPTTKNNTTGNWNNKSSVHNDNSAIGQIFLPFLVSSI